MMQNLPHDVYLFQEYHALVVRYRKEYLSPNSTAITSDPLLNCAPSINYSLKDLYNLKNNSFLDKMINKYGYVERTSCPDPFWGVIYAIIGQLISAKAAQNISTKFTSLFPNKDSLSLASIEVLQSTGLTKAKATYIKEFVEGIEKNLISFDTLSNVSTDEAIVELCKIKGIGVWSAKIILIHSFNYMDIDIYEDVAL